MTTGHRVQNGDGQVDFGLVMAALSRMDILSFNLNKVISAQVDKFDVLGFKMELPSNIAVPKQRESYTLPVNLEKPQYRLFFPRNDTYRVFAAQGRFPLKKVVDGFRAGKKVYELVNEFSITGGVVRDVAMNGNTITDFPVNELAFTTKKTFKATGVANTEVLIALALADMNGYMIPTDFKRLTGSQAVPLSTYAGAPNLAAAVLKNAEEFEGPGIDRISVVMVPFNGTVAPQMLPLIPSPRLSATGLEMTRPRALDGVAELATMAMLSDIQEMPSGSGTLPFLVNMWEVYSPEWVSGMNLPQWPGSPVQGKKKKWEVTFLGSKQLKVPAELGQAVIDASTHFTHSSLDF